MLLVAAGVAARADFNCTMVRKSNGNTDSTTKYYLKGQRMMTENAFRIVILNFDAKTNTIIDKIKKTYAVYPLKPEPAPAGNSITNAQFSIRETGQHRTIEGFNASQAIMTGDVDMGKALGGLKIEFEIEIWYSPDVPGAKEMHDFHQRNKDLFPWAALAGGGSTGMGRAMADMQKQMSFINGVPVLQITHVKPMEGDPKITGPMVAALDGTSVEMGGFSSSPIPDSVFAIPAGYTQVAH
jgi:hypothetical protein